VEKSIKYYDEVVTEGQAIAWKPGTLLGFGLDYRIEESGNGIACGHETRAIVRTQQGKFMLLDLKQILDE
jgi:hypothetical protein